MNAWVGVMCALGLGELYLPGQGDYGERRKSLERADYLTSDIARFRDEEAAISDNFDLAMGGITYAWLRAAKRSVLRLEQPGFAEVIKTPTLVLLAGADRVVDNDEIKTFAARMPRAKIVDVPGARHELLKENDEIRTQVLGHIMRYLKGSST